MAITLANKTHKYYVNYVAEYSNGQKQARSAQIESDSCCLDRFRLEQIIYDTSRSQ